MKINTHSKIRGFTIVELITVIAILGILATITYLTYSGIQTSAQTTAVKQDLAGLVKALRTYYIRNQAYPTDLTQIGYSSNKGTTYQITASGSTYCVTGTNGKTSYKISNTSTNPQAGGCPGHGVGGQSALVNMAPNPGIETSTSGLTCYNCTAARDTSWKDGGNASVSLTPSGPSNDSFLVIGGDLGGFRAGMQAGKTYTISATIRLTGPQTGTLGGNGSRQITAWYTNGGHNLTRGSQAPNAAGQQRVSVTYTIPPTATAAWIRLYNGASSGNGVVWYDNIMITEGSTVHNYGDGNSANWVWDGTANLSTSRGPAL